LIRASRKSSGDIGPTQMLLKFTNQLSANVYFQFYLTTLSQLRKSGQHNAGSKDDDIRKDDNGCGRGLF
jgi:hypothetical protein